MTLPTGMSTGGFPYLQREAWERFRDTVPHILAMGPTTLRLAMQQAAEAEGRDDAENVARAARVIKQVVYTAAITAPPDLWLLRHVLGAFAELGLLDRLRRGEAIYPESCVVDGTPLDATELDTDLRFLLARGIVEQYDNSYRIAGHPRVLDIASRATKSPFPASITGIWRRFFAGESLTDTERELLVAVGRRIGPRTDADQNHWVPTLDEIEVGYRLVPIVLALRAAERTSQLAAGQVSLAELHDDSEVVEAAAKVLRAAGWLADGVTPVGARGLTRGPGPFGIIETYHPYMDRGTALLRGVAPAVWVKRGENVGASQDANRGTFKLANDALDRFCADTGFSYTVFIEHAIGRGEATRQRRERSGDTLAYFGADLEDAAIDAAIAEQAAGELPPQMTFVRGADIGQPAVLIDAIVAAGADPNGAVMLVGNGFHEVRDQTDEQMVEVFRQYHDAGILLVFTEENALAVDDLRATAFNTYHAGFKYVHEKSGQGLRPAYERPAPRLGPGLRAAWNDCATKAGYVRLDDYCSRARTVYPYTEPGEQNPSISVGHFVIPAPLAAKLSLDR